MSKTHVVAPDETLASIALQHGFSSANTLWDHPQNAKLREIRQNPLILFEGDEVFIPERESREEPAATERRHRFETTVETLELHVKVLDQGFQALQGNARLLIGSDETDMRQENSIFKAPLPPDTRSGLLDFPVSKTQRQRPRIEVRPGRLDPLDTVSGQQQRLNNLGYFAGFVPPTDPRAPDSQFRWAVEEFQCDHMGPPQVDGIAGPLTLKKLKAVYGC